MKNKFKNKNLSIERVRERLNLPETLSDSEVDEIRSQLQIFARVIIEEASKETELNKLLNIKDE